MCEVDPCGAESATQGAGLGVIAVQREWMHLIIALGPLHDEIVAAANAAHSERYGRHKETKGDEWVKEAERTKM